MTPITAHRLWIGLFSLAFLLLSGFNGYRLIDLESRPWTGDPSAIKALRSQLDRLNTSQEVAPSIEWREPSDPEAVDAGTLPDPSATPTASAMPMLDAGVLVLPVLTGIVSVVSPEGQLVYRALLDGDMKNAGQSVGDFHITQISDKGVRLRHHQGRFFLPNRDPIFSIDRGSAGPTK
jgi:hypothetical protein